MTDPDGTRWTMMDGSGGAWMGGFAAAVLLLLLIAVAAVLGNLFLHLSAQKSGARPGRATAPDARAVLDARLARGEVQAEEYRVLRDLLEE